MTLFTGW